MLKPFKPLTIRKDAQAGSDDPQPPAAKRRKVSEDVDDRIKSKPPVTLRAPVPTLAQPQPPLQTVANPPSSPKGKLTAFANYYSVLWRVPTNKKNKTWSGDGTLVVTAGTATFYDGTGKQMGRKPFSEPLLPGSAFSLGGKELEVESLLSKEEFVNIMKPKRQAKSMPPPAQPPAKVTPPKPSLKDKLKTAKAESKPAPVTVNKALLQPFKGTTTKTPSLDKPVPRHDPDAAGAVVFKRPKKAPEGRQIVDVVLDPMLSKKLRPHQKEGVKFMYECVMGLREHAGDGCILADDMGLGKTLQTIALLWTLIMQNPIYKAPPVVKKALIVCPVGLIKNWKKEFNKWLPSQYVGVLELEDAKQVKHLDGKAFKVMIIGYERLRALADDFAEAHDIDIIICDEGHRLKTVKNKAAKAIESLNTSRRVILSGTPVQNNLNEFYAMVNFVNDGCLGSSKAFAKDFETPIMKSRQPDATEDDIERGEEASEELSETTAPFILRRTADILAGFLPQKNEYVLFCNPTPEQALVYQSVVSSAMFSSALGSMDTALQLITILKKLCNSPALMKSTTSSDAPTSSSLATLNEMLPAKTSRYYHNRLSSKIRLLDILLQEIKKTSDEKVVLVSNYTSTLNLMADLLDNTGLKYLRLDGSVPAKKRQGLVDQFNRAKSTQLFAFLLSAKAGGVGIDLTGASRLVLFDVDWNPATDEQAIARIHRQGQKRPTYIYRFLIKGGLEERIWQRQVVKLSLADSIVDSGNGKSKKKGARGGGGGKATFSLDELKDLFRFDASPSLRTHDLINCPCGGNGDVSIQSSRAQTPDETEDDADISSFVRSSQLSGGYPEDESGITSPVKRARKRRQLEDADAEAEELMKYTHLATKDVCELPEDDMRLIQVEEKIGDPCLMHVLRQDQDVVGGGVAYVFKKTKGVEKVAEVDTVSSV
jgi:DNA repair and recombination protein RAD54B